MTDSTIITPTGVIVVAYVRHPIHLYEHRLYSLTVCFRSPLRDLALISADGQIHHRFTSGVPPDVVGTNGCALTLRSEIGRDSTVRIRFVKRCGAAVLQAVQIIELHSVNPFAGIEP